MTVAQTRYWTLALCQAEPDKTACCIAQKQPEINIFLVSYLWLN